MLNLAGVWRQKRVGGSTHSPIGLYLYSRMPHPTCYLHPRYIVPGMKVCWHL